MIAPPVIGPLVAGLLIAFGFQLLLVNVGIALGIAAIKFLPGAQTEVSEPTDQPRSRSLRGLGVAIALAILITFNLVLFVACFLAVRLSATSSLISGAILGLVIWSAYFLILSWLSSTAIGTVSNLIQKLVSTGWQGISAGTQTIVGEVVERVSMPSDSQDLQDEIAGYLLNASRQQFSSKDIQNKLQEIMMASELDARSTQEQLAKLKRDDFVVVLNQREDLSPKKIAKIADRLEVALLEISQQAAASLTTDPVASNHESTQPLQSINLTAIDPGQIQAEIFSFLKQYPFLAPKLVQLLFQVDWQQWFGSPPPGDRPSTPADLPNPLNPLPEKTANYLATLKQGTLRRFAGVYQLTAAVSGWVTGIALTSLLSAAIAGALAAYTLVA